MRRPYPKRDLSRHPCVTPRCPGTQARNSDLCAKCAEKKYPGKVKFMGRWRTPEEVELRLVSDAALAGVSWERDGDALVGRQGTFEIRVQVKL